MSPRRPAHGATPRRRPRQRAAHPAHAHAPVRPEPNGPFTHPPPPHARQPLHPDPYPSDYMTGAQGPMPAFPVRAACEFLADAALPEDEPALLRAQARAIGVFFNVSGAATCLDWNKAGRSGCWGWGVLGLGPGGRRQGLAAHGTRGRHVRDSPLEPRRHSHNVSQAGHGLGAGKDDRPVGLPGMHGDDHAAGHQRQDRHVLAQRASMRQVAGGDLRRTNPFRTPLREALIAPRCPLSQPYNGTTEARRCKKTYGVESRKFWATVECAAGAGWLCLWGGS